VGYKLAGSTRGTRLTVKQRYVDCKKNKKRKRREEEEEGE
jgi:hypothetical protein